MRLSDVVTFRDVCASFFVLNFEPEKTKRARTEDGKYKGDDPKTKNINEAYENE